MILDHILHLNFTDCFGGKGLVLDSSNGLQILPQTFPFPLSLGTLHFDARIALADAVDHQFF